MECGEYEKIYGLVASFQPQMEKPLGLCNVVRWWLVESSSSIETYPSGWSPETFPSHGLHELMKLIEIRYSKIWKDD